MSITFFLCRFDDFRSHLLFLLFGLFHQITGHAEHGIAAEEVAVDTVRSYKHRVKDVNCKGKTGEEGKDTVAN